MTHIVVGTAGHIDHGKSALVRALTGTDPDRLQEEKDRGITIDLGFAQHTIGDVNVAFVDVPGHERFVRNMLAGASGIDAVLLVVAADESIMPQTREHFEICELLGVDAGVVALTKSDLVDAETVELVRLETADLVRGSFLEDAPVVPVSSKTGAGLDDVTAALVTLTGRMEATARPGIARLPIDRAFTVRGFGTVVTGTLVSGRLTAEAELDLLPAGRRVRVRGLHVHGQACQEAVAGQRVAANLSNVEVAGLARGDSLVDSNGLDVTRRVDARLQLLASAPALKHGARVRFHAGTSETMARISLASRPNDAGTAVPLNLLEGGHDAYVRVRLERPVALTRGDRFVLRAYSPPVTIAGGQVLDPAPGRGRLRTKAGFARLRRLDQTDVQDTVAAMVADAGARGLQIDRLIPRAGVAPGDLSDLVETLVSSGRGRQLGPRLLAPDAADGLRDAIMEWVESYHEGQPLDPGLPREEARERFSHLASPEIFDAVVKLLVEDGTLMARDHLAVADHRVALSAVEERATSLIAEGFERAGLAPPDATTLATDNEIDPAVAERMLRYLVRAGVLVPVESQHYHASVLDRLRKDVATLRQEHPSERVEIDVAAFKERYGISRKYAIPLLGYLDRERVTRRIGNVRVVL